MTMNEKSLAVPGGDTRKVDGPAPARAITASAIAFRHSSVRDSAQEFQIPDAQFSVSKNQLMPQTGTVAATIAATGRPVDSPRRIVDGMENRASRRRMAMRSRKLNQALAS